MIEAFTRTGPLMEPTSYPGWAQQLLRDCSESKRRVVEHELYRNLRDGSLSPKTMRQYLVGGWPVVEQFALYMAQNLTKTRFARHPGEDMARRWLMRNIRVELNHADYWVHWCNAHGVSLDDLQAQDVPAELQALSHWCWQTSSADPLIIAVAATNYAIEGATGEWSALVCSTGKYAEAFPEEGRKRAMKWLRMHAQYDDAHPWEALEIICTLAGNSPTLALQAELRRAICKSYDYMFLFLERCMELEQGLRSNSRPRAVVAAAAASQH
ncbi:MAG: iron-containing redox enzyme family protein [Pseudomonas sp.]|uniref:TenA family transcriptional regulator n=1 Tax=Pseudomonas abieticivorans TaxID=2931382 RepID=UPI0020BFD04D|nr:iron-containing redox enzyme family protein [Pseudomonas sp. PIA16]MDE1164255.1 iron-containing redox enzyme family protein [Pseudomonas sp.]